MVTPTLPATSRTPLDYQRALSRQTLLSERVRAVALSVILAVVVTAVIVAFVAMPGFGAMMPGMTLWTAPAIYGPFLVYELAMIAVISQRLARNQDLPVTLRYLGAFVEVTLPSVILVSQVGKMELASAFGFYAPFFYSVFIILSTLRLSFWLAAFTGAVAAGQMLALALYYLPADPAAVGMSGAIGAAPMAGMQNVQLTLQYHLTRSAALLAAGVTAGWVAVRLRQQFEKTMQAVAARDSITNLFGQHVSPQVVDRLLEVEQGKASEIRRVAVMFVDIRDFTTAAQMRTPAQVVKRLDDAFTLMVEVIDAHSGVVNKFLGDGLLAVFGAPLADEQAARHAVTAGREILQTIEKSNTKLAEWPIRIGIGLHVGEAVTGIVGSPRRKEYTVIGDTVNLASRIEALNKEFGSQFLLSDAAHAEAGELAAAARQIGNVEVRGYDKPVGVWRLA